MSVSRIMDGAYLIGFGGVNAVLLDDGRELTLIDAGLPDEEGTVWTALERVGRRPRDLRHLVLTHAHPDHIGSAAAIVRESGARTYMTAIDAAIAESGGPFRHISPAPGLFNRIGYRLAWKPSQRVDPVKIDQIIGDGEVLPLAGGLKVIATPGHCAGQVALIWKADKLLIAGDVATNIFGLGDPLGFEDEAEGRRSQCRIADLHFEAIAFGHGRPISLEASPRLRRKWGSDAAAAS